MHRQGDDADDVIECPFCGYEVAKMMIMKKCDQSIAQNVEQS